MTENEVNDSLRIDNEDKDQTIQKLKTMVDFLENQVNQMHSEMVNAENASAPDDDKCIYHPDHIRANILVMSYQMLEESQQKRYANICAIMTEQEQLMHKFKNMNAMHLELGRSEAHVLELQDKINELGGDEN